MCIDYFDKEALERWFNDNGDETHRINYDLNENSIVLDLGGYLGEWSEKISNKYKCKIYIFEPVLNYYNTIVEKFKNLDKVKVFNYGLADITKVVLIKQNGASSSMFLTIGKEEEIKLMKFSEFIEKNELDSIDLLKINIEGGEYTLLEHITEINLQSNIKNIQIQFHKMFDGSHEKREKIRHTLSKTHKLTYDYNFVWENWEKI